MKMSKLGVATVAVTTTLATGLVLTPAANAEPKEPTSATRVDTMAGEDVAAQAMTQLAQEIADKGLEAALKGGDAIAQFAEPRIRDALKSSDLTRLLDTSGLSDVLKPDQLANALKNNDVANNLKNLDLTSFIKNLANGQQTPNIQLPSNGTLNGVLKPDGNGNVITSILGDAKDLNSKLLDILPDNSIISHLLKNFGGNSSASATTTTTTGSSNGSSNSNDGGSATIDDKPDFVKDNGNGSFTANTNGVKPGTYPLSGTITDPDGKTSKVNLELTVPDSGSKSGGNSASGSATATSASSSDSGSNSGGNNTSGSATATSASPSDSDSKSGEVSYDDATVKAGESTSVKPKNAPENVVFMSSDSNPDWVNVNQDGEVTLSPNDGVSAGKQNISVQYVDKDKLSDVLSGKRDGVKTAQFAATVEAADGSADSSAASTNPSDSNSDDSTSMPSTDDTDAANPSATPSSDSPSDDSSSGNSGGGETADNPDQQGSRNFDDQRGYAANPDADNGEAQPTDGAAPGAMPPVDDGTQPVADNGDAVEQNADNQPMPVTGAGLGVMAGVAGLVLIGVASALLGRMVRRKAQHH